MTRDTKPVPDYVLERFALGELPTAEQSALERRIAAEPELRARLDALTRSNEEILREYAPAELSRRIEGRVRIALARDEQRRARGLRAGLWIGTPVLAAAAVLMLTVTGPDRGSVTLPTGGPDEITRIKGNPQLFVHREQGGVQTALSDHSTARAGDVIQLSYRAGGAAYGIVLSIDGRGAVTVHLKKDTVAAPLAPNGLISLDHAYELDDAPNFERFFFVTAAAPFEVQTVIRAAKALAVDLDRAQRERLPIEQEQVTLLLEKSEGQP